MLCIAQCAAPVRMLLDARAGCEERWSRGNPPEVEVHPRSGGDASHTNPAASCCILGGRWRPPIGCSHTPTNLLVQSCLFKLYAMPELLKPPVRRARKPSSNFGQRTSMGSCWKQMMERVKWKGRRLGLSFVLF